MGVCLLTASLAWSLHPPTLACAGAEMGTGLRPFLVAVAEWGCAGADGDLPWDGQGP